MSYFLRLIEDTDRGTGLYHICNAVRAGQKDPRCFEVDPAAFEKVPGKPFAYWISDDIRNLFGTLPPFESDGRVVKQGLATADDFRFVRSWWETSLAEDDQKWVLLAKGGAYSPFYSDVFLKVNWKKSGSEIKNNINSSGGVRSNVWMLKETELNYFGRIGITWPLRTQQFGPRILPRNCIFGHKGPVLFDKDDDVSRLFSYLAIFMSKPFGKILSLQLNAADSTARSFEVGVLQRTILPSFNEETRISLVILARRAWECQRETDSTKENTHAFIFPSALAKRVSGPDAKTILESTLAKIDAIAFDLYRFSEADRGTALGDGTANVELADGVPASQDDDEDDDEFAPTDQMGDLLSWAVGVAFGQIRLAARHWRAERPGRAGAV